MHRMIWPVIGDGHCAFRSVAQGAYFAVSGLTLDQEAETMVAHVLRDNVVFLLEQKADELLENFGFCSLKEVSANPTLSDATVNCLIVGDGCMHASNALLLGTL
jgi:hypothetical protein